jgi:hypothetical protein
MEYVYWLRCRGCRAQFKVRAPVQNFSVRCDCGAFMRSDEDKVQR